VSVTVPELVGVNDDEQVEVVALTVASVHGAPAKEPVAVPLLANETVPLGAEVVPGAVSLTKAVQLVACETTTAAGEHATTIDVDLPPTVTVLLVLGPLPRWEVSVGVYVELATTFPVVLATIVTMQLDTVALTTANVQGEPLTTAVAVPVLVTATVPAGADAVPAAEVSLTKDVQVIVWPVDTDEGVHVTTVEVVRFVTVTVLPAVGPLPL